MIGPLARIILRYVSAALVTYGLVDENTGQILSNDTDLVSVIQVSLGFVVMVSVEGYYFLAKKYEWTT